VPNGLHSVVIRSTAALGWDPGDDLVRIVNVARLAVHAVRRVQADAFAVRRAAVVHHLVNICRTKILARAAEFSNAALLTDVGVVDDEMRRLIFLVLGAGVIEVSQFVEGQLAVTFKWTEKVGLIAAVGGQFRQFLHALITRYGGIARVHAASAGHLLDCGVEQARPQSMLEPLVEIADLPQLVLDPAIFYA